MSAMTDLERRALLGDAEAQRECTEKGIVLACPCCRGKARVRYTGNGSGPFGYISNIYYRSNPGFIMCDKCGLSTSKMNRVCRALAKWNTRPAPPIGRCGECKHSTNPAALTMIYGEPGTLTCHHGPCNRRNVNENDFCSYFEPKEEK